MKRGRFVRLTLLTLMLATLFSLMLVQGAYAEDIGQTQQCLFVSPNYEAVWHPGSTAETMSLGLSWNSFLSKDSTLRSQGWRLHQLHTHDYICGTSSESLSIDALWTYEPSVNEAAVYAWSWTDFNNKNNQLRSQGWRLVLVDSFMMMNGVHFSATWRPSTADQVDIFGWASSDFLNEIQSLGNQGWGMTLMDSYLVSDGTPRYNASWRRNIANIIYTGWAPQDFETKYSQLRNQGWNLDMETIPGYGAGERYTAAWRPTGLSESRNNNMNTTTFAQTQQNMRNWGWNMEFFEQRF